MSSVEINGCAECLMERLNKLSAFFNLTVTFGKIDYHFNPVRIKVLTSVSMY